MCLFMVYVAGRSRVPLPPAKIRPFIWVVSSGATIPQLHMPGNAV